jgi:hypothetical protein
VLLPQPLGPISAVTRLLAMRMFTFFSAGNVP